MFLAIDLVLLSVLIPPPPSMVPFIPKEIALTACPLEGSGQEVLGPGVGAQRLGPEGSDLVVVPLLAEVPDLVLGGGLVLPPSLV